MNIEEICTIHERILDLENIPKEQRIYYVNGKWRFIVVMLERHKNDKQYLNYALYGSATQ